MKRKMVSFILCIAMCMALAIPAFAVELSPYATDEVGNFSQMIEFAFSDNVEGRFRYSYNDAAGNVVDGIVIKEISTDGTTKLNFVEGDKSDKVEIDSIRDVILNGNCITAAHILTAGQDHDDTGGKHHLEGTQGENEIITAFLHTGRINQEELGRGIVSHILGDETF